MAEVRSIVQSSAQPLQQPVRNFSKQRYISDDWMRREWQSVWSKCWQVVAPASDLGAAGDFVVYEVGRESLLLTCDKDGVARAFYNVCQHRGVRLVDEPCGRRDSFRCPYHSWRYNPEGELTYAPASEQFQHGLPQQQVNLEEVRCATALGLVWVCLDAAAPPLTEYLQDMLPLMQHYQFEAMTLVQDQTVLVNCNWKAVVDNFGELYHVHYLHPQHRSFVDCTNARSDLYAGGHTRVWVPGATTDAQFSQPNEAPELLQMQLTALGLDAADFVGRVEQIQPAIRAAKRKLAAGPMPHYGNFSDEELTDVMQTNVFPNMVCTYQPEMMWLMRVRPHATDPNQCYLDKLSFEMLPEVAASEPHSRPQVARPPQRPQHESFTYQDVIAGRNSMTPTIDQDLSLLRHAQQGMHSAGFAGVWLHETECRVAHFHQYLDELLGEANVSDN